MEGKPGCAVGRLIADKELCTTLDKIGKQGIAGGGVDNQAVFDLLPDDLKEYGQDFLQELQWLHDADDHWTDTGLSDEGEQCLKDIKKEYCT